MDIAGESLDDWIPFILWTSRLSHLSLGEGIVYRRLKSVEIQELFEKSATRTAKAFASAEVH